MYIGTVDIIVRIDLVTLRYITYVHVVGKDNRETSLLAQKAQREMSINLPTFLILIDSTFALVEITKYLHKYFLTL